MEEQGHDENGRENQRRLCFPPNVPFFAVLPCSTLYAPKLRTGLLPCLMLEDGIDLGEKEVMKSFQISPKFTKV